MTDNSSESSIKQVQSKTWFHRFEVVPGVWSPGRIEVDAKSALDMFDLPEDLRGKRVIDIGALDGAYSFEFARRGAEVVAVDIQDPERTGFNVARRLRQANVEYCQCSVYELAAKSLGTFDIAWYWGVFYHLKEPLSGFREIFEVLESDGMMIFEGEVLDHAAVNESSLERYQQKLSDVGEVPLAFFTSGAYAGDSSNWWIPNIACLKEWITTSGFTIEMLKVNREASRALGVAHKDPESWLAQYEYPSY